MKDNIKIVPYQPIHGYMVLEKNTRESDIWISQYKDWDKAIEGWSKGGPAFTLFVDGEIVGCAGIVLLDWQRGEAWTLFTSLFMKYKKIIWKNIKIYLDQIQKSEHLRRIHALVRLDFPEGCRFLEHLGFENETPNGLRAFGPNGETLFMYGREYKWMA